MVSAPLQLLQAVTGSVLLLAIERSFFARLLLLLLQQFKLMLCQLGLFCSPPDLGARWQARRERLAILSEDQDTALEPAGHLQPGKIVSESAASRSTDGGLPGRCRLRLVE